MKKFHLTLSYSRQLDKEVDVYALDLKDAIAQGHGFEYPDTVEAKEVPVKDSDLPQIAEELVEAADFHGITTIKRGAFLATSDYMAKGQADWNDDDPCKSFDFGVLPYWITTDDGIDPIGITGKHDTDLWKEIV
jgi:hypothetical protein